MLTPQLLLLLLHLVLDSSFTPEVEMRGGRVSRRPSRQAMLASTSSKVSTVPEKSMVSKEEKEEEFQTVVLGLIARYSRYSWLTWIVVKIILKVTTYTVLKADKMDEEAHTWITDWGPFVNPVISLFSLAMKPSIWTLEIVGLREPLAELGWHLYKNSVFYGLLSDQPGDDLVERSWASQQFSAAWTSFLRFGAENTLAIPALWILWLVALDFFRWKDRSKQRKVLRSLTKESEGGSSQDKNLKSITLEDKQAGEQKNWGNVVRRYKPRRVGTTSPNFSNRGEPKLALEGPPSVPEKEDEDAFSVTEFFKDMCTIWNCLATQSKTKDVKANQKAIEDKSEEPLKDPLPLLPAIEHSGDKIEETSGTLDTIEKEGGSQLEVENSESEDGSETSSGGEIVDYQSMIYLPEKQLKQIGKALAALHCWYCKVKLNTLVHSILSIGSK